MLSRQFDLSLKIVFVGDSGVGKTAFLVHYVRGVFDLNIQSTLEVEFFTKEIKSDERRIQLQLWDTVGQELFRSVTRGYYRGATGALLFFDIGERPSFGHVTQWLSDVREVARANAVSVLVGNKADLGKRAVSREEAEAFAQANQIAYVETSAKTGLGIHEAIDELVGTIEQRIAEGAFADDDHSTREAALKPPRCGC